MKRILVPRMVTALGVAVTGCNSVEPAEGILALPSPLPPSPPPPSPPPPAPMIMATPQSAPSADAKVAGRYGTYALPVPDRERYAHIEPNPVKRVAEEPVSTFCGRRRHRRATPMSAAS